MRNKLNSIFKNKIIAAKYSIRLAGIIISIISMSLILPAAVLAASQDNVKIDNMTISVMPEYDDSRVLAVIEPVLSSSTRLPLNVKYLISKKHTNVEVGMACEVASGGGHQCKTYNTVVADDFNELSYQVDASRNLFLEYYWDPFKDATDNKRNFVYEFKSPYKVERLDIQIQQPLKGTDFKIEPASSNILTNNEGFKVNAYSFTNVQPGQVLKFDVSYISGGVSKAKTVGQSSGSGQNSTSPGIASKLSNLELFLIVGLLTLAALAFFWYSKSSTNRSRKNYKAKRKSKKTKVKETGTRVVKPKSCSNCGYIIETGSNFCNSCGWEVS